MDQQLLILKPHNPENEQDRSIVVDHAPFMVGRRPENDYQLMRADISGRHAVFDFLDGQWWLADNNSTNGTFVNAHRLDQGNKVRLNVGDVLYFATKGFVVARELEDSSHKSLLGTKILTESTNIRGVMQLIRVVNEQRTFAHFQPILDLELNETVGWEALGRAITEDGLLPPNQAFFLASQNKSEARLSRRFRESAVACARCYRCWKDAGPGLLFVNLHTSEIPEGVFLDSLRDLADSEFRKKFRVVVEMPESWVCKTDEIRRLSQQVRSLGMQVAYDDFGVGQSRLTDLREVPPDFVKLDKELIRQSAVDPVQRGLVQAIVDACRKMQIRTLAEGIETEEERATCLKMRINLGQGYLFGKPAPAWEMFAQDAADLPNDCQFVKLDLLPKAKESSTAPAEHLAQQ